MAVPWGYTGQPALAVPWEQQGWGTPAGVTVPLGEGQPVLTFLPMVGGLQGVLFLLYPFRRNTQCWQFPWELCPWARYLCEPVLAVPALVLGSAPSLVPSSDSTLREVTSRRDP